MLKWFFFCPICLQALLLWNWTCAELLRDFIGEVVVASPMNHSVLSQCVFLSANCLLKRGFDGTFTASREMYLQSVHSLSLFVLVDAEPPYQVSPQNLRQLQVVLRGDGKHSISMRLCRSDGEDCIQSPATVVFVSSDIPCASASYQPIGDSLPAFSEFPAISASLLGVLTHFVDNFESRLTVLFEHPLEAHSPTKQLYMCSMINGEVLDTRQDTHDALRDRGWSSPTDYLRDRCKLSSFNEYISIEAPVEANDDANSPTIAAGGLILSVIFIDPHTATAFMRYDFIIRHHGNLPIISPPTTENTAHSAAAVAVSAVTATDNMNLLPIDQCARVLVLIDAVNFEMSHFDGSVDLLHELFFDQHSCAQVAVLSRDISRATHVRAMIVDDLGIATTETDRVLIVDTIADVRSLMDQTLKFAHTVIALNSLSVLDRVEDYSCRHYRQLCISSLSALQILSQSITISERRPSILIFVSPSNIISASNGAKLLPSGFHIDAAITMALDVARSQLSIDLSKQRHEGELLSLLRRLAIPILSFSPRFTLGKVLRARQEDKLTENKIFAKSTLSVMIVAQIAQEMMSALQLIELLVQSEATWDFTIVSLTNYGIQVANSYLPLLLENHANILEISLISSQDSNLFELLSDHQFVVILSQTKGFA